MSNKVYKILDFYDIFVEFYKICIGFSRKTYNIFEHWLASRYLSKGGSIIYSPPSKDLRFVLFATTVINLKGMVKC